MADALVPDAPMPVGRSSNRVTIHRDVGSLSDVLRVCYREVPIVGTMVLYEPELAEWERIGEEG